MNYLKGFSAAAFLAVVFVALSSPAVSASESYWLDKPVWEDLPSYAEDISLSVEPTSLIQAREFREECSSYSNTTLENGTTVRTCDSYVNVSYAGSSVGVFDVTSGRAYYLGDGYVRTNITVGLNQLSEKTLKEALYLMGETQYLDWFNSNYFYEGGNMSASDLSEFQSRVQGLSPSGENTGIVASKVNSIDLESGEADMTVVFRFEDFRSGVVTVSDLLRVEVVS